LKLHEIRSPEFDGVPITDILPYVASGSNPLKTGREWQHA
jgi:hypothetical protein